MSGGDSISLNDHDFLELIINSFKNFDQVIRGWCTLIRGTDLSVKYASPLYIKVFHPEKNDNFEFVQTNPKHLQEQQNIDLNQVIKERKKVRSFAITEFDDKLQPFSLEKSPIINPATDNVVGIFCSYRTLSFISMQLQIIRSLGVFDCDYSIDISKYKLTTREKEAIFLFLSGLSSKDIAFTLSKITGRDISKSTIDSLFRDQLFVKFEVYNRDALFAKLIRLGFDRYVPTDLLPKVEMPVSELIAY
ncbi:helix-turn-helix transcriptional regulator [Aquella oligotrophica]|uniref:Uncharacterized protein n=1 Tax=Aquella oligotrophica TaxID=2067065 RepID=A0A2I7N664_9NEIS|nr:helix-turn-helix transcriptional regulator [Aquella oligotrophica]AUR51932.1 hypothetical protein CUN60_06350 [Aquella oligotrophica]